MMIKDKKIADIFQIPPRMLYRWKKSNDYKYLIYTFLNHSDAHEVEAFFNFLTLKGSKDEKDTVSDDSYKFGLESKKSMEFMYKKDFLLKVQEHLNEIVGTDQYEVYPDEKIVYLLKDLNKIEEPFREIVPQNKNSDLRSNKKNIGLVGFTFFAKDDNDLIYVELSNRITVEKPLKKKIEQIKKYLDDNFVLRKMVFLTNEQELPRYVRENNQIINDVEIVNINIDTFVYDYLDIRKIIFVPPELKIPT